MTYIETDGEEVFERKRSNGKGTIYQKFGQWYGKWTAVIDGKERRVTRFLAVNSEEQAIAVVEDHAERKADINNRVKEHGEVFRDTMGRLIGLAFRFGTVQVLPAASDGTEGPWFVVSDLAGLLGYRDTAAALRGSLSQYTQKCVVLTKDGRQREVYVVNASGMYALIMRARATSAVPFKLWVLEHVLPSIATTGSYMSPVVPVSSDLQARLADSERAVDAQIQVLALRMQRELQSLRAEVREYIQIEQVSLSQRMEGMEARLTSMLSKVPKLEVVGGSYEPAQLTVKQLGKFAVPPMSADATNRRLCELGFQEKVQARRSGSNVRMMWKLTLAGYDHACVVHGVPGRAARILWKKSVVMMLRRKAV